MRCRNGAKSGLASGMRSDSTTSPPPAVKRVLERGLRLDAGRPVVDQGHDALRAVLRRPFAHDPRRLAEREAGAHHVGRLVDRDRGARHHHDGRRSSPASPAARSASAVGVMPMPMIATLSLTIISCTRRRALSAHAGVVADDQLDLAARDRVAVLLHVEPDAAAICRPTALKPAPVIGMLDADLERLLRGGGALAECRGGERRDGSRSRCAHHVVLPGAAGGGSWGPVMALRPAKRITDRPRAKAG